MNEHKARWETRRLRYGKTGRKAVTDLVQEQKNLVAEMGKLREEITAHGKSMLRLNDTIALLATQVHRAINRVRDT